MANPKEHFDSLTSKADPKDTPPPTKAERFHVVRGIPHKVVKSHYDPKLNCVMDTVEVNKIVKNRRGDDVPVTLFRVMRSADAALQAKHCVDPNAVVELEVTGG